MKAYKGFNRDMTCRGFQYAEGQSYKMDGEPEVCKRGFHACANPIECLGYYAPGKSVYHEVELDGDVKKSDSDTKCAATKIKIGARLDIAGLVKAAIDFMMSKVKPGATADEAHGLASERGDQSAASATGDKSACSADSPTAIAVAWGIDSKAKGVKGAHIVLSKWHWDSGECKYALFASKMVRIDGKRYKPDTWYCLNDKGRIVKAPAEGGEE